LAKATENQISIHYQITISSLVKLPAIQ